MIKRLLHRAGLAGLFAFATLLAACGGGGDSTSTANGQLRIRLTDSQSCNYESVFVTVTEVRVSQSSTASDSDSGWEALTLNPARQVDLMTLRNGAFEELGTLPLPAGTYQQVRLVLASNGTSAPYANYLTLSGAAGAPIALKTPSAQQSGLKLNVHATVDPGQLAELTLDFDPCKSVVKAGNSGKYNLKPVVTAYTNAVNDIEGYTVAGALVSAAAGGREPQVDHRRRPGPLRAMAGQHRHLRRGDHCPGLRHRGARGRGRRQRRQRDQRTGHTARPGACRLGPRQPQRHGDGDRCHRRLRDHTSAAVPGRRTDDRGRSHADRPRPVPTPSRCRRPRPGARPGSPARRATRSRRSTRPQACTAWRRLPTASRCRSCIRRWPTLRST